MADDLSDISSVDLMTELLRRMKCAAKRLNLVGPPGCGKGNQSPIIKDEYCLCHLATGDMLRAAVAAKTRLGLKAKEAMDNGQLVSDDLVVGIVLTKLLKALARMGLFLMVFQGSLSKRKKCSLKTITWGFSSLHVAL